MSQGTEQLTKTEQQPLLLDADLHQRWASDDELIKYLPERYKDDGLVPLQTWTARFN